MIRDLAGNFARSIFFSLETLVFSFVVGAYSLQQQFSEARKDRSWDRSFSVLG